MTTIRVGLDRFACLWRFPGRPAALAGFCPVKEDEMRNLSRSAFVLVVTVALVSALPAQAAPAHRAPATPASQSLSARLGSAWTELIHFFAATTGQPAQGKGLSADGGSCIDPNGCAQAQLFRH
jgi:hypothetical protein